MSALFTWAYLGNCGRIADLEHFTYGVRTTPYVGDSNALTYIGYGQTNPFTITATSPFLAAGRYGACIAYYPTRIGQYTDGLIIWGVQALYCFTMENFILFSFPVRVDVSAQTPVNNSIVITGANLANFVTGTPVRVRGSLSGEIYSTRSYWLIKQGPVDTYSFARNPMEAAAGVAVMLTQAWPSGVKIEAVEGGVTNGFTTYGTNWTQPTMRNLATVNIDNGFVLDNISGANGEFTNYINCSAGFCKRFYWQKSPSGQAYRPTFRMCGAGPRVYMSNSMPTTGTWKTLDFVENTAPSVLGTAGNRYIVEGWKRLTSGNSNVLNVDWVEKRFTTGT